MHIGTRIAAAQLASVSRHRRVVAAAPFTGLLTVDGPDFMSYAVAASPGSAVHEVTEALAVLRAAFAPGRVRFELVEEASPGAVDALVAAGVEVDKRMPLLTMDPADLTLPPTPAGVVVELVTTAEQATQARTVANAAFGMSLGDGDGTAPPPPVDGGSVLATLDGVPVAAASWTAVADEVTEIVGVATLPSHQRRGLGALVTAHAVQAGWRLAGATLPWLTPGDDGADRVYRRLGFVTRANAVHLADPAGPAESA
ncbi:GNAT family N-acetyltransferase [Solihabitans fulvus]|uniref:GNAT family N-acetyltransferase n=1 Tax=Solihabitans fulvus TaxID=1892852 RepID=A0A5B2XG92_9PSEU|nr:GNAT family N-acetyltransferase [Solihabitans fulvus]KAA2262817.1 GNAT family N-acetyltransferase [Solihabitans fulvus]